MASSLVRAFSLVFGSSLVLDVFIDILTGALKGKHWLFATGNSELTRMGYSAWEVYCPRCTQFDHATQKCVHHILRYYRAVDLVLVLVSSE